MPADAFRALALLLFIVAIICLAVSVGVGRRGYGFTLRYFLLAAPVPSRADGFGSDGAGRLTLESLVVGECVAQLCIEPTSLR